jgi:hypothetical protein
MSFAETRAEQAPRYQAAPNGGGGAQVMSRPSADLARFTVAEKGVGAMMVDAWKVHEDETSFRIAQLTSFRKQVIRRLADNWTDASNHILHHVAVVALGMNPLHTVLNKTLLNNMEVWLHSRLNGLRYPDRSYAPDDGKSDEEKKEAAAANLAHYVHMRVDYETRAGSVTERTFTPHEFASRLATHLADPNITHTILDGKDDPEYQKIRRTKHTTEENRARHKRQKEKRKANALKKKADAADAAAAAAAAAAASTNVGQ